MEKKTAWLQALKLLLLTFFLVETNIGFQSRVYLLIEQERFFTLLVFVGIWGLALGAVLIAAIQPRLLPRVFWTVLLVVSGGIGYGYANISQSQLAVHDVISLWSARHEIDRALDFYAGFILTAGLVVLVGFVAMLLPSPIGRRLDRALTWMWWVPAVPVLLITVIIYLRSGGGTQGLPQQFSNLAIGLVAAERSLHQPIPKREPVYLRPTQKPAVKHIVLMVDESIRPDVLSFEAPSPTTPNLSSFREKLVNFGVALSAGNCSHYSNAILRLGGTRDDLVRSVTTSPTIWEYAAQAGFKTVYIDAQATQSKNPGILQNFMTVREASFIDEFHSAEGPSIPQNDFELLEKLLSNLSGGEPTFFYVNKNGAHFPYDTSYPRTDRFFTPTYDQAFNVDKNHQGLVNSYNNAVRWSVDRFFKVLFERTDLRDTLIIYTSDHGQNLQKEKLRHCSTQNAQPIEALVPLVVISGNEELRARFKEAANFNFDRSDHFAIFPTLLNLFGYERDLAREKYGDDLLAPLKPQKAFTSGDIFGLFGEKIMWNPVDERRQYLEGLPSPTNVNSDTEDHR